MEKYVRPSLAEFLGTFALVFVGGGATCAAQLSSAETQPAMVALCVALAEGFVFAAMLAATLPVSGGFLNPAVTLTLWVFRRLEGRAAVWLIAAQFLGALLAGLALRMMFTDSLLFHSPPDQGITPHVNVAAFQGTSAGFLDFKTICSGIGVEVALTFVLVFVIYGTVFDPRGARQGTLAIGLALTAIVLTGFTLTGAAVNPARWLGPVLWELTVPSRRAFAFADHTVYWIGPVFGALLGGAVYEYLILPGAEPESSVEIATPPVTSTLFRTKK